MIKDIEISNFRCFEHTKIEGFERVNLIGGKNNSGKTALLEAIFLYSYTYPNTIHPYIRGIIRRQSLAVVQAVPKNAWDNLLFNLDMFRLFLKMLGMIYYSILIEKILLS